MKNRRNAAGTLIAAFGSLVLLTLAPLHGFAYTQVSPGVSASNLSDPLKSVFRVAFLDMAWHWIVLASIVLVVVFVPTRLRKALLLLCGVALLFETGLTLHFTHWFIGNEMTASAGLLISLGGLLIDGGGLAESSRADRAEDLTVKSSS